MLLATNNSDYDSNDPANLYLAQLYAAQQQAAASLNAKGLDQNGHSGATSSSPSSSSDSGANLTVLANGVMESKTNLIVNYLPHNMSQDEVRSLFASMGPIESCKLVRDKATGERILPRENTSLLKYKNADDAKRAQQSLNGLRLQNKTLKVSLARPSHETIKAANLYVSGLPRSLTQPELEKLFTPYGNIITSRILSDNVTGLSKGVGFVRFDKKKEAEIAIDKLNGTTPPSFTEPLQVKFANNPASTSQKAMLQMAQAASTLMPLTVLQAASALTGGGVARRVPAQPVGGPIHHQPQVGRFRYSPIGATGLATTVNQATPALATTGLVGGMPTADLLTTSALLQMQMSQQQQLAALQQAALAQQQANPGAAASSGVLGGAAGVPEIFVYNLSPETEEATLWQLFGPFGAVLSVKLVKDFTTNKCKGYGFVTLSSYENSVSAINALNGTQLGNRTLQVSFKSQHPTMMLR